MSKFDKAFAGIILGVIIPVISLSGFWWSSLALKWDVKLWGITGIILGILFDIMFLKKLILKFYYLGTITLLMLYAVYSIGIFGFFMGVPVFNVFPGIVAGIYVGRKLKITRQTPDAFKENMLKTARFSSAALLVVCSCSAYLALQDPFTGANLRGMLNLSFEVTAIHIWLVIILGGAALLLGQYLFLMIAGRIAYENID